MQKSLIQRHAVMVRTHNVLPTTRSNSLTRQCWAHNANTTKQTGLTWRLSSDAFIIHNNYFQQHTVKSNIHKHTEEQRSEMVHAILYSTKLSWAKISAKYASFVKLFQPNFWHVCVTCLDIEFAKLFQGSFQKRLFVKKYRPMKFKCYTVVLAILALNYHLFQPKMPRL